MSSSIATSMNSSPNNESPRSRNLFWRLIISVLLISTLGGLFYLDYQIGRQAPVLLVICLLLALRGSWEMTALLKTRSFHPQFYLMAISTTAIIMATWLKPLGIGHPEAYDLSYLGPTMLTFSLVVMALFMVTALRFREPGTSM